MIIDFIKKAIVTFLMVGHKLLGDFFWLLLLIGYCLLIPDDAQATRPVNGEIPNTEIVEIVECTECEHCNYELVSLD